MYYTKGTIVICGIIIILVGDGLGGPIGWIIGIALGGAYLLAVRAITKRIKARTPRVKRAYEKSLRLYEERYQNWEQAIADYTSFEEKSKELLLQDGVTAEQRAEIQKTLRELKEKRNEATELLEKAFLDHSKNDEKYAKWLDRRLSHRSMDSGDKKDIDEE